MTFYDGVAVLGTGTISSGQATLTTALLPFGNRLLRAYYAGNSNYAPSTSAVLTQNVKTVPGGGFGPPAALNTVAAPTFVAVGDFNNDGKADLVTANSNANSVSILLGKGDETFQPAVNYGIGPNGGYLPPFSVAAGDFNGDGNADHKP